MKNRESTLLFTYSGNFGGVLDAMINHKPSKFYYETPNPSTFLRASFQQIEVLAQSNPEIELLTKKGLLECFQGF